MTVGLLFNIRILMKYLIIALLLLQTFQLHANDSHPPELKTLAFSVKHAMIPDSYKDVEYKNGEKFPLGKKAMAYKLYYSANLKGQRGVLQINCSYRFNGKVWEQSYCKAVKFN